MLKRMVFSLLACATTAAAQKPVAVGDTARASVMAVVKTMFDGMRAGDSAMVRSAFHPSIQLSTSLVRGGVPSVNIDSANAFLRAVGTPHPDAWDERTRDETVFIDQGMAMVWAPYGFWAGTRFSHCGVDAFTLARTANGWKIVSMMDTRQRTGCPEQVAKP